MDLKGLKFSDRSFFKENVIIDCGCSFTKCGFGDSPVPLFVVPYDLSKYYLRENPLTSTEWRSVAADYLSYVLFQLMNIKASERRLVIGYDIYAPESFIDALCDISLNSMKVLSIYVYPSLCSSLYGYGNMNGLIVNIGYLETQCIAMIQGTSLQKTLKSVQLGSKNIEDNIKLLPGYKDISINTIRTHIQNAIYFRSPNDEEKPEYTTLGGNYQHINISAENRWKVTECLFSSEINNNSIPLTICDSLLSASRADRVTLIKNILISGGLATLPGLKKRLYIEIANVIVHVSKYKELIPLLRAINIVESDISSFYIPFHGLSTISNLDNAITYITAEMYAQNHFKDPLIHGNI
ncbi:hypothetical protein WA158_004842 [Blastocystis sp. Blastoise]